MCCITVNDDDDDEDNGGPIQDDPTPVLFDVKLAAKFHVYRLTVAPRK
jgi:hypothetical protein